VLSIVGFVILVILASVKGDALHVASCIVYGLSLVVLYGASTLYHSTTAPKHKEIFRILDHSCIYLLIAGSYTPFGMIILNGSLGLNLVIIVWTVAGVGILLRILLGDRFTALYVVSYLAMGWIGVFGLKPLLETVGIGALSLVVAGGAAYSLGVVFFAWKHFKHHHAIFHIFVLAGSILHYLAVVFYVVPAA
jgi:hemolysin III